MSLRLPAAPTTLVFLLLLAVHGRAADFVDSTERYVAVPDRIGRVMPADQSAAVRAGRTSPTTRGWRSIICAAGCWSPNRPLDPWFITAAGPTASKPGSPARRQWRL